MEDSTYDNMEKNDTCNSFQQQASSTCIALSGGPGDCLFQSLSSLTPIDLNMLRILEDEYQAAALRTTAQDRAQRIWAFRAGLASMVFIVVYFLFATLVLLELAESYPNHDDDLDAQSKWTSLNTALFVIYTATTVGYGHMTPPDTSSYYIFNIFNIMIGMAGLAVMVAQVFMWMALEARGIRDRRRAIALAKKSCSNTIRKVGGGGGGGVGQTTTGTTTDSRDRGALDTTISLFTGVRFIMMERCLPWFHETAIGGFLSVFFSLLVITLIGAIPIGALEGWSFLQSVYFGIVSMSTVGYGDVVPETTAGIVVTIIWLPLNILFTAIYMGSIARWYLNFSSRRISRIKEKLKNEAISGENIDRSFMGTLQRAFKQRGGGNTVVVKKNPSGVGGGAFKMSALSEGSTPNTSLIYHPHNDEDDDVTESEASSSYSLYTDLIVNDGHAKLNLDDDSVELSSNSGDNYYSGDVHIMRGAQNVVVVQDVEEANSVSLTTMKDLIDAVHDAIESSSSAAAAGDIEKAMDGSAASDPVKHFLSLPSNTHTGRGDQPSLALRVLVQERLAHIVTRKICGETHHVDIKESYILYQIGHWKRVLKKWRLPSGSWKAFRACVLEAMILVGEKSLLRDGPNALFELPPDEFHSIFSPVVVAMGTADTLNGWLQSTEELARQAFAGFGNESCPVGVTEDASLPKPQKLPRRLIVAQDSIRVHRITRDPFPESKCLSK